MKHIAAIALAAGVVGTGALAQSPAYMIEDCQLASQQFYQEFEPRQATYEGQRVDGTHAVNGTIYLENRSAYYSAPTTGPAIRSSSSSPNSNPGPASCAVAAAPTRSAAAARRNCLRTPSRPSASASRRVHLDAVSRAASAGHDGALPARRAQRSVPRRELRGRWRALQYRIVNPDGSALLDAISVGIPYRGQLWQSGDHIVEVINRSGSTVNFQVYFEIE
jgi:hypothetical protein